MGITDKTEALLDVIECGLPAKFWRSSRGTVLQQDAIVAEEVGILQRRHDTLVSIDASKK